MSLENAPSPSPFPPTALETVQSMYAAFGRADVPAFLAHLAADVHWRFVGAPGLRYSRDVRGHEGVQSWLADVVELDDIQQFEPREFFACERHVTVWGWERTRSRLTGQEFECEWVHVFELAQGRITRFSGLYDSARVALAHGLVQAAA